MALTDPQSVTINAVAISLPRVSVRINGSTYTSGDGLVSLRLDHNYGRRNRHVVRIDHSKIAADPYTAVNTKYSMSVYTVIDVPPVGYTNAEAKLVYDGFKALLAASSDSIVTKLQGGES